MDVSAIALRGLDQAQALLERSAGRIARMSAPAREAAPMDVVDLSAEMVALLEARRALTANLRVLETADEIERSLFDSIAAT